MKMKLYLSCMAVVGLAVTVLVAQPPGGGTRPADPAQPGTTGKADPVKANALDGTWTVVSIEKNGQAMKDAKDMTVTVKDNTVTFNGKDNKQAMAVRFEFAGPGQARVTMDEGSGGTGTGGTGTGGTGTGRDDKGGTGGGAKAGSKQAVYVLTNDYLAVCIHDDKATGTGGTGGTGTGGSVSQPTANNYCSIIMKRSGSGTGGTGGTGR